MQKDHRIHAALYGGQGFHNVELITVNMHLEKVGQCFSSSLSLSVLICSPYSLL